MFWRHRETLKGEAWHKRPATLLGKTEQDAPARAHSQELNIPLACLLASPALARTTLADLLAHARTFKERPLGVLLLWRAKSKYGCLFFFAIGDIREALAALSDYPVGLAYMFLQFMRVLGCALRALHGAYLLRA